MAKGLDLDLSSGTNSPPVARKTDFTKQRWLQPQPIELRHVQLGVATSHADGLGHCSAINASYSANQIPASNDNLESVTHSGF